MRIKDCACDLITKVNEAVNMAREAVKSISINGKNYTPDGTGKVILDVYKASEIVSTDGNVQTDIDALKTEDTNLASDITDNATAIANEVTARTNADNTLQTAIDEINGSISTNASNIASNKTEIDANATAIANEITARQNADDSIQSTLNDTITGDTTANVIYHQQTNDDTTTDYAQIQPMKIDGTRASDWLYAIAVQGKGISLENSTGNNLNLSVKDAPASEINLTDGRDVDTAINAIEDEIGDDDTAGSLKQYSDRALYSVSRTYKRFSNITESPYLTDIELTPGHVYLVNASLAVGAKYFTFSSFADDTSSTGFYLRISFEFNEGYSQISPYIYAWDFARNDGTNITSYANPLLIPYSTYAFSSGFPRWINSANASSVFVIPTITENLSNYSDYITYTAMDDSTDALTGVGTPNLVSRMTNGYPVIYSAFPDTTKSITPEENTRYQCTLASDNIVGFITAVLANNVNKSLAGKTVGTTVRCSISVSGAEDCYDNLGFNLAMATVTFDSNGIPTVNSVTVPNSQDYSIVTATNTNTWFVITQIPTSIN